jgi:hypothetical protein
MNENETENQQRSVFAVTPALAVRGCIDYSTKKGFKMYERGSAPLRGTQFDLQRDTL